MSCTWGGGNKKIGNGESIQFWIDHFIERYSGKFEHCRFTYPASMLLIMFYCLVFRIKSISNYLPFDENVQNYRKSGPILSQFNENNIKVTIFPKTYLVLFFSLLLLFLHRSPTIFCVVFVIVPLLVLRILPS